MRKLVLLISLFCLPAFAESDRVTPEEEFKGRANPAELTVGGMAGMGILDSTAGFLVAGALAKKIVNRGFVPDVNNQVFVEALFGPLFIAGSTAWFYSTHLRWDFKRDSQWTFYGLGGLGGHITSTALGDRWTALPRFGIGTFVKVAPMVTLRGEISHELITLGISYSI